MPSQINLQITGKIGNIIFYKRGDKYYARSVAGHTRQTKATKKRATEFGKASRAGKILRQQLLPVIPFPADKKMQTRLVSDLFSWLRSGFDPGQPCDPVLFLNNFRFTESDTIAERWRVSLDVVNAHIKGIQAEDQRQHGHGLDTAWCEGHEAVGESDAGNPSGEVGKQAAIPCRWRRTTGRRATPVEWSQDRCRGIAAR